VSRFGLFSDTKTTKGKKNMKNIQLFIGLLLGTFALIVVMAMAFSRISTQTVDTAVLVGSARTAKGPEDAPITIVEFSDLQCPACAQAETAIESVLAKYPEQIRFIYRHFPIESIHPYAFDSARVSEYANQEGKFYEFVNKAFADQSSWSSLSREEYENYMVGIVKELELQEEAVRGIFENPDIFASTVREDQSAGYQVGISGTPTIFVNGQEVSYVDLESAVENLLQK
jgi:protein-disulfide isomerase